MTVDELLAFLKRRGTKANRDGLARYAITAEKTFGVSVATLRELGKKIGRDHDLALALWDTGWYEARMLVPFIADPARTTPRLMDRWARDFDNWAICDALCFHLFDKTPHAFAKVRLWASRRDEFVRRAAFALLASLALHDKGADDATFLECFPLIESAASDERNFVKKAVSWALRGIGKRNASLRAESLALATRLAASKDATERWIGKDAVKYLRSL